MSLNFAQHRRNVVYATIQHKLTIAAFRARITSSFNIYSLHIIPFVIENNVQYMRRRGHAWYSSRMKFVFPCAAEWLSKCRESWCLLARRTFRTPTRWQCSYPWASKRTAYLKVIRSNKLSRLQPRESPQPTCEFELVIFCSGVNLDDIS